MAGLVCTVDPVSVQVTGREPERVLAWSTPGNGSGGGRIALQARREGSRHFVSITAEHSRPDPGGADAALEQLLDELGSPERRPFERG